MGKRIRLYAVAFVASAAVGVTILRIGLVAGLEIWTADGRLAIPPWQYAALNGAHIGLMFVICAWAFYPHKRWE